MKKLDWDRFSEREEKEHRSVLEMIKKRDEKALGNWLKNYGKGKSLCFFNKDDKRLKKNEWCQPE
jgi:hypothetical protein